MNIRKQVPVGTSDFKKIIEDYYYIDKSLLIKDILDTKSDRYPGVIFEFKILRGEKEKGEVLEEKLKALARDAYKQIQEKNYEAELRKRNVEKIYKYGVAFYKKTLSVYGGIE